MTNTTATRPAFWSGVDASDFEGGQVEIDWAFIDTVVENCGGDAYEAHHYITELAIEARDRGDLDDCAWFASMGMACLNYGGN